ncbi:MAG: DUF3341 domain-containing protein, partial [Pseudomonadota bacterium]
MSHDNGHNGNGNGNGTLPEYGLLAEYEDVTSLKKAAERVRDAGYERWDCYSPFPVHGLDPAMGIRRTRLPYLIMAMGMTGTLTAMLMQWWMNAIDYPYIISGKPFWSLPANIPIMFELTVLFAGVTAFLSTLGRNGLPRYHHPLFNSERFTKGATDDKFFIAIEASDPKFDAAGTRELLEGTSPTNVETVTDDSKVNSALPKPLVYTMVAAFVAGFIPLGVIATMWYGRSELPRIHPNPNMDFQEKFKTQTFNKLFEDTRSMRPQEEGTVADTQIDKDNHRVRGLTEDGQWARGFPAGFELTEAKMNRGQDRYNIYCQPCHGAAGYGQGPVHKRAAQLKQPKWVQPSSFHQDYLRTQ